MIRSYSFLIKVLFNSGQVFKYPALIALFKVEIIRDHTALYKNLRYSIEINYCSLVLDRNVNIWIVEFSSRLVKSIMHISIFRYQVALNIKFTILFLQNVHLFFIIIAV